MEAILEREQMARPKGRPKSVRDEVPVRLDRSLAAQAKLIAAHRGITIGELMAELLSAPIGKAYLQMVRDLEKRGTDKK